MKQLSFTTLLASLIVSAVNAQQAPLPEAMVAPLISGVDRAAFDGAVRAQDDFFRYSQGAWLKTVDIPSDRSSWGAFNIANENVENQLRSIIEDVESTLDKTAGSDAQKVGDFYVSFMDEEKRDALGLAPLKVDLAAIAAANDKKSIATLIGRFNWLGVTSPFGMSVHQDNKNSTQYIVDLYQSGLGLPNRDYYLVVDDAKMADARTKYQLHLEKLLTLSGHTDAASEAKQILELETEIAKAQWSAVENRDPIKSYNKLTIAQLTTLAPALDWPAYLEAAGVARKLDSVIVSQPSYLKGFSDLVEKTPLPVLKVYFEARLISDYASYLSAALVAEDFSFNGTTLSGVEINRPLQKRAIATVDSELGEIVGKLYVERFFPEQRKKQVQAMVQNFLLAFKESIETLDWMTPATKKEAQIKLSKISVKVGYTDKWRDYSTLVILRDDLVGNVIRARHLDHQFTINKLGHPIDRDEWGMTPQTVNAYYNPEMNEIVFPAARLQVPLYDPDAEPAINYGAVGISIGHEISHAFDDQGSQYDGDGNLHDWWTQADREQFAAKGKMLVSQYNAYSPLPGYNINGELTLGENIADNAGAIMAFRAYKVSLAGQPAPVIDGWTAEQRLFIGIAQARRGKMREPRLISMLKSDPHSPSEFRVNGSLRNHPAFYDTFSVKSGDQMYLAPEKRVVIW